MAIIQLNLSDHQHIKTSLHDIAVIDITNDVCTYLHTLLSIHPINHINADVFSTPKTIAAKFNTFHAPIHIVAH